MLTKRLQDHKKFNILLFVDWVCKVCSLSGNVRLYNRRRKNLEKEHWQWKENTSTVICMTMNIPTNIPMNTAMEKRRIHMNTGTSIPMSIRTSMLTRIHMTERRMPMIMGMQVGTAITSTRIRNMGRSPTITGTKGRGKNLNQVDRSSGAARPCGGASAAAARGELKLGIDGKSLAIEIDGN